MAAKRTAGNAAARRAAAKPNSRTASATGSLRCGCTRAASPSSQTRDASQDDEPPSSDSDYSTQQQTKRRKTGGATKERTARLRERLFANSIRNDAPEPTCPLPSRLHSPIYHRPLLLHPSTGRAAQESLLNWFDGVSSVRSMPWRQPWVDPDSIPDPEALRAKLERRAYQVWISEIMLQQTRVAVVIDYWKRWMAKWPTIHDLAAANADEVLAAWRGLGYYSRATRIHEAAKKVVDSPEMRGLLPEHAKRLEAEVPGVGRYTAGAISSIVFGRPEPMVDGNVLRVLSRQLGLLGNVKTDKVVVDTLWAAADALVKDVARAADDGSEPSKSDRPGRWGQGLMELGSTVCTPKPNCSACPITSTCRAYLEGQAFASGSRAASASTTGGAMVDIEDACDLCEPFEVADQGDGKEGEGRAPKPPEPEPEPKPKRTTRQPTLASFAFTRETSGGATAKSKPSADLEVIANHARRFPLKSIKKAVREEETLVCAIQRSDGTYLVHRRPEKGLLAGLWEFPSRSLDASEVGVPKQRTKLAQSYAAGLLGANGAGKLRYEGELGSVPWLFSHLKLTMHVHLFHVQVDDGQAAIEWEGRPTRWSEDVDQESMGTGMHKCWTLVKEHQR